MKSYGMRLRNWNIICCLFVFLVTIIGGAASEFSADKLTKTTIKSHPVTFKGKVYVKGGRTRIEQCDSENELTSIQITLWDKGLIWDIASQRHVYWEYKLNRGNNPDSKNLSKPDKKLIGKEKCNGYLCEKYKITQMVYGKEQSTTLWYSGKLKYNIKIIITIDGTKRIEELSNIKEGKVPDTMFILPKGLKKQKR